MRRLRQFLLLVASLVLLVCIVLLLNFTAPNPTGRRYSSETVDITGSSYDIGLSGERVLSKDLRLPRNEEIGQQQCICNLLNTQDSRPNQCRSCFASITTTASYRLPDFVSDRFIADSKNEKRLTPSDPTQITDYALVALELKRPLWLYVRTDTFVRAEYTQLAEATGGGVVYYFTTPGYVDPIDQLAFRGAALSLGVIGIIQLVPRLPRKRRKQSAQPQAPPPPRDKVGDKLHRKVADMESFAKQGKDRARRTIDEEDSRHEE